MDFYYSDRVIGIKLNKVALLPSPSFQDSQLNIKFNFAFKSKYGIFIQNQDDPTSLRFLERFQPSTCRKTSACVAIGESLSLENILGPVGEAIGDHLVGGDREDLMVLASAEVRRNFPTSETLRKKKLQLLLSFQVRILYRQVHVVESDRRRMVPAADSSFALLEKYEVDRVRAGEEERRCCICLEELAAGGGALKKMPCSHVFHGGCVVEWLRTSHYCPLCRYEMPTQ